MSTAQFASMTAAQAEGFMPDAPPQPARKRLAALVGARSVIDIGCSRAEEVGDLFTPEQYLGVDCSRELVLIAQRRWPKHSFLVCSAQDLPDRARQGIDGRTKWDCGIVKAVLEHVPAEEAVAIYEAARLVCRTLFVCWHWEPVGLERKETYDGELGKMLQIRHRRDLFSGVLAREAVHRHTIWTVAGRP